MAAVDWIQRPAQNSNYFSDRQVGLTIKNDNNYLFKYFSCTSWGPESMKNLTISVNVWLSLHVKNMKLDLDFRWLKYVIFRVHPKKVFHFKTEPVIPPTAFDKLKKKCGLGFIWTADSSCSVCIFFMNFYFIW